MFEFLKNTKNKECIKALNEIATKIDMDKIDNIINNTPYITHNHKKFLTTIIKARKTLILNEALHSKTSRR